MKNILDRYLDRVLLYANKPAAEAEAIRAELQDHLLQKIEDLGKDGMPREEAILEALRQHGSPKVVGYKLRGPFPWVDIRSQGTARGVIAIGPKAVGVFAFGGMAVGVFACGGLAAGLFSAGGLALGLLFVWGGFGIGGVVNAGFALGVVAAGGCAVGLLAAGGMAIGVWVPPFGAGPVTISYYTAKNVPPLLKSLAVLFKIEAFMDRYIAILIPVYVLAILGLSYLQVREAKRTRSEDDWLING